MISKISVFKSNLLLKHQPPKTFPGHFVPATYYSIMSNSASFVTLNFFAKFLKNGWKTAHCHASPLVHFWIIMLWQWFIV
jgi:hypothetical protein